MVKAITPQEVLGNPEKALPDFVIEAINGLVLARFHNGQARFTQNEAVQAIVSNMPLVALYDVLRRMIFDNVYLNFEAVYRKQGWNVYYDSPGYNESYEAYFIFKQKR